ncbi:MAG: hypothetical protein NZ561_04500, partial [Phycisphaerae bacterium]|nr:hypothetical protein [Phycisphaerae bacterium]
MESVVRLRRRPVASGLEILDLLTILQHLHPHRSLGAVLLELCNTMGTCRAATDRAVEWLNLDGTLA